MIVNDVAMIAADTSRSRAYIQALVENNILPNHVLIIKSENYKPGQYDSASDKATINDGRTKSFNPNLPIVDSLVQASIPFLIIDNDDINSDEVVTEIHKRPEKVFIYSGFGGVILKNKTLEIGKKFLHVHGGYLPKYKGSTTNYFSLLSENYIGATSIFLSEEIDSGEILIREKFKAPLDRENIDHIYDSEARAKVLVATLKKYRETGRWDIEKPDEDEDETYYIIHPVLKHISILSTR